MKLLAISGVFSCLYVHSVAATVFQTVEGCTLLSTDSNFPTLEAWQKALPGVLPRRTGNSSPTRPDYRLTARSVTDVQNAVQFVTKHNLRLSIINTGHDYHGRNDAPSGLSLDVSQLRGVRVSPSFIPTEHGAKSPVPGMQVEVINQVPGQQPAVTFGAGVVGSEINRAIKSNKLFIVSGGAGK
jgi:FAD/FMN-containing dehydrogenase